MEQFDRFIVKVDSIVEFRFPTSVENGRLVPTATVSGLSVDNGGLAASRGKLLWEYLFRCFHEWDFPLH